MADVLGLVLDEVVGLVLAREDDPDGKVLFEHDVRHQEVSFLENVESEQLAREEDDVQREQRDPVHTVRWCVMGLQGFGICRVGSARPYPRFSALQVLDATTRRSARQRDTS